MKAILALLILSTLACDKLQGQGPFNIPVAGEGYSSNHPAPAKLPGQDSAEAMVWIWTYGGVATYMDPPPVVWVAPESTCTESNGVTYTGSFPCYGDDGICCNGIYITQSDFIYAVQAGAISDSSYAHELCHAWKGYSTGDFDTNHTSECYVGFDGGHETLGSLVFEGL
jgi:hypothetical protein